MPTAESDARQWLARLEPDREAGIRLELAIAVYPGIGAVGSISLADFAYRGGMIRYWLLPAARGRGVASAAVRLLAGWAIDALQLARIWLQIEPITNPHGSSLRSQGVRGS